MCKHYTHIITNILGLIFLFFSVFQPREKGRMRFHRLQNVQIALDFLKQRQVKLVNIRNDDITDGNPKLTLGLIWTIILHFQISEIYVSGESGDLTAKEKLLLWSQQATEGWPGLRCTNFSSSWSNGHMFNALLHRFRPDLIDMEVVAQQSNLDNLEQAFEIAESLGVTRLLDAEDVDVPSPDEKSVITYVSSIYDAFPKIPEGGEGIAAHEVDHRWAEYRSRFSTLLQWSRQHKALMANKNFPLNPVELKALYNEYVHFKETEIPAKELEKSSIERLYKLLEVWMEFGRIKLPLGLHPNDLEEEWGKLILEMLEREKALRPAVERLELLLQMANKIQNMALDCEEKLTLAKNTLQADMSLVESGEAVRCERELGLYLQDCEALIRQLNLDLNVLRDEKYYQVEQLAFRVSCLHEELVSLRLQCSSVYRKGHFSPVTGGDRTAPRGSDSGLSLSTGAQTLLGAVGVVGAMGAALLRRPMSRSQLVAMSSSEDEGSLRFIYELLGWVEETQDVLERAEWGADLPSVEQNLQDHHNIHTAVEELLHSLKEARNYETKVSPNFRSSYSDTLAKLEHQYCKLLEHSSWRLRCLESLHAFVCCCTEELIWLNEREEEELAYDWSQNNTNINAKRELYAEMRSELEEKQEVMHSLQETADRLCQENHPAKQTVEAYSAALQTQWQWVRQLCVCVEQHLKDNTAYFQFVSDARDCETYLRQLQDTIKRQYTCDKSSRLGKLEDLLQDSMEEKEQLIEYRSSVASLVGRAKTVVQLRPRSTESTLGSTTPIRAICDYRQIEITISRGEECVLGDNSQRTKWKVISPSGNEAMVPSVCFTVPPPNQEAMDTASRMEQLYQSVMSLWHNLHVNMKSVVSWHYLQKDISTVSSWSLDTVRSQPPVARDQALDHLEAHLADFLSDSKESALFTPTERRELEREAHNAQEHCQDLLVNMETVEKDESVSRSYLSELQNIKLRLEEAEQRLMRGIQTLPPSNLSGDSVDNTVQIAEQEKLQSDLDGLRISLGEVSRRCVSFFEEKPTSSSVPVLRSELNLAVEKIDRLHNLSSVYLHKLKTVDMLMYSLQAAESQVKRYESRLSEEDIVPADTNAIQALREQLGTWQSELEDQEGVFSSLQSAVQEAREAGTQLNKLHPDRSPELERYQERAAQLTERWAGVKRQMDTRRGELEALGSVLQQYRDGHSALIHWIEETTERQENTQPGKTDSKVLSEQLAQQTALVADIEKNQTKLDECQTHSKQYCTSVKDYELQLMTFRAFVESTQKSTGKRRRMHSSSDAITQEFMDLRTRYTALVTLTTQHVKYISDALRRLEEEEVLYVSLFFIFFFILSSVTSHLYTHTTCMRKAPPHTHTHTQVQTDKLLSSRLSPEERAQVTSQLDELTATYSQLCDSSTAQLQQLVQQQSQSAIGGVIDLGTMETIPVFKAAQRGLIDLDTCHVLLEAQLTMGGLFQPDSPVSLSLEEGLNCGLIDSHISQSLSELESALHLVDQTEQLEGQLLPVAAAMEAGLIKEEVGLRILELQINTGGLRELGEGRLTLNSAGEMGLLSPRVYTKLGSRVNRRELIDPNTADKLNLDELQQRCILSNDTGLYLLPVKQQPGGTVCLRSGRKVGIFRAVQEGLIDRQVTVRLLEAQLFAGGISDPRSGHLLTVNEAVHHNLMDQDLACAMLTRQLQSGGILDPVTGDRLGVEEAIQKDLLSPHLALLVLESLWAFIGMLWPESGELLPIAEALQQGVISGELAWNILRQRHAIGALYLPETPKVVSLNQAKEVLEPKVAEILKEIQIPDVLHNMNQSGSPKLNRLIRGSTGTSHPPSSSPASSPGLNCDPSFLEKMAPEEQAHHRLLFHLMTHSYVDAHSGQRLVLLEPELVELVKAAAGLINVDRIPGVVEEGLSLITERQECMEVVPDVSLPDTPQTREIGKVQEKSAIFSLPEKYIYSRNMVEEADNQGWDGTPDILQTNQTGIKEMGQVDLESTMRISEEVDGGVHRVKGEKNEMVSFESAQPSAGLPENQLITDSYEDGLVEMESEGARESGHRKTKEKDSLVEDVDSTLVEALEMYSTPVKPETLMPTQYFKEPDISKESVPVSVGVKYAMKDGQRVTEKTQPQVMRLEAAAVKSEEDVELERLASELQQGGLLTEGGQRLLPDEAVAQGVLPGHTAVKLMAKAGLFGGFLDVSACESLSMEDVMQEGLLDDNLMWSVLKSEKTLAGVVDVEKGKICTLKDAAQAGLIDSNTAARLLEAQVVSGGVVDLRRDKKVSVTLAANLGLIEEDQREKLFALEKSYRGKGSDPDASLTKATLQLQMNGVVDPKTKSPVPLKQALERGLLGQEEVYQALSQQVAEGGIVHHNSGVRLSVSDALKRGLVDCAISPKLWELERACQGEVALSSNPDAALLQASTGAILDPDLKCRLTLTEAVSDGLLNESIAKKAMVSPGVTEGVLDPQSAQIVPYSDLVNQGKIDIKSGKRFLVVKPFKGIQDKQTGEILNLAKAIASQQVDPVPALRMLQSQADTGGIIDISNGARLPLPKASNKGLVGEHMARLIATNQVLKGGLLDPSTGQRVSSLKKAVKDGLISREMAAELQDNLGSMEVECDDEDSSTPSSTGKSLEIESNQSINLLAPFTINAEKRLQQALQEMETPQDVTVRPPEKDNKNVSRSVGESSSIKQQGLSAMGKEPRMDSTVAIGREGRDQEGNIDMSTLVERDEGKTHVVEGSTERVVEQGRMEVERDINIEARESDALGHASPNSKEAEGKSKKKRKNKKKGKGKEVNTEQRPSEKADIQKTENKDQNAHSEGKGHNCAKVQTVERFDDPKDIGKVREGSTVPPGAIEDALEGEREGTENKVFLVQRPVEKKKTSKISKASEKVEPVTEKVPSIHDKADSEVTVKKAVLESLDKKSKIPIGAEKVEPSSIHDIVSKDVQKWEVEQIVEKSDTDGVETVSQQTGPQEHKDRKEVEFTLKTTPVANDKEALLLKAKESILRKVLGRGVSEKQAAEELEALRQVVGRKESLVTSEEEVKTVGSPPEVSPEEREGKGIDKKEEGEREKVVPDHSTITVAAEEVKKALEECLERDQQIVALLSMVRHIEVRVKQQQQQSVGRSLIALDDIIKQTDVRTLDLELRDLEPQVNKAVDAAGQLLEPRPQEVPPQLLLALEKDGRSLARGRDSCSAHTTAPAVQGQHTHHLLQVLYCTLFLCTFKCPITDLCSDSAYPLLHVQLFIISTFFFLSQELQLSLSARSNDVNTVAFDLQVFISERAQDLTPEQSRHLLGQLQQLQRGFHRAAGQAHAKTDALAAQREREEERQRRRKEKEEEEKERERERESAREREVCKPLAMLHSPIGVVECTFKILTNTFSIHLIISNSILYHITFVTIRSVEEFLAEHGDSLSPEERANLQGALSRMKEQYSALTNTAQSSLAQLDTAISTTVQQNTQRAKAVEELQETHGQINSLLEELSSLNHPGMTATDHLSSSRSTSPEGGLQSHSDMLQVRHSPCSLFIYKSNFAELQQLQAQQAQLMQVSQNARSLLDQPDSAVPAKEKRRLRDQLDQLQTQHQEKLRACQERLRRSEALKDELAKFLQEHGGLGTWLEQSEGELCSLGEGETDLAEDVICHKADLRFVSISGQKVLDSVQGALEKVGGSDPALQKTKQLVTGKLQDANHRYSALHTKVTTLTLSPPPLPLSVSDGLEKRFSSLSESVSERAEQLQTSVAQSVSVQEGLKGLLAWLDGLLLTPGPVQPTAQAVQDALTQNQKLRQELLSRQGSVEATCDSVSKLLQSSDASTASGLQRSLESLTQSYAAAQAKQAEREAELRGLLPKLENYERLSTDLQGFTQTCLRALSPAGQPDRSVEDYRQTIEVRGGMKYIRLLITFKHFFTKDLLSDWEAQGVRVQELNKTGSELETLIINITAPQTKTVGLNMIDKSSSFTDLTELQVAVAEVNGRYEELGEELKDRQWRQEASLELRQKARQGTEELSRWLGDRENSLHLGQTAASPSKPEVVRAQAQENKALLSELAEHSGKVKELKSTLEKLIADNPDSPEADTWRQQIKEIDSRWAKANEAAVQRQVELETCADRLGSFATAASQLGPWLKEKELMMSVLGPLSIDPNMLNTQNQQVQFMLREFETRRPQFDQLTQAAEGILSPSGGDSSPQDAKDLAEVRSELGSISQQWDDLTQRLSQRSEHIDQAQGTSQRYQALLKNLSVNVGALGERLDGQASLSAQPEALKRRLQETGEIRSELEQRREELGEAEKLCGELSAIVVEPYLRDELKKRLESVSGPLRSLEERAADGLSQLQAALSSTQQFQQMFKELRSWLDNQSGQRDSTADSLPCQPEAIRTLLAQQDELHRGVASQRGPYELIQAEGASLLASLPTGGEEQSALLSRLTALRRDWDELNQCITERQNRLKSALTKAESYQQHRDELTPWVAECEEREADIQPSLDPAALDEALQKARQLGLDLERRRPLLEALNTVADQLLEHCRVGEEDVRDEKAQLNRRVDGLAENLQNRVSQLEELVSRLKEFEDGRQAVERRLEAARHQIEVQEALGPQACSNKSLERLRSQQETLHSLQPQVAYLRDLAQGLVQDTPHTEGGGGEGGQRLEQQIEKCCSTLESRLQGVGEVQSSVRDLFSHLADLDDELDSLSPVGRDADSLASQADAVHAFLARLATLRSELEGHGGDCTAMLRREGSSPDLLALRRETEALSRQAGKLSERGQARLGQIEVAAEKVGEFYAKVAELQGLLGRAEEGLNAQGVVGTEVETIKQQLHEFKAVEREQVDSIQPKLQRVNAVGQGLIQSAAKHTDTQALEHDLEATNLRWNSLNKRVAERIAQLQEALLHCGKFQDALEPLLSWLSDTEELVANQKPPSVEYRVVKAQIQEQKLLQRLLDDRRATFQMIQGEGERIAATAETQDRDKIQKQLESLGERWGELLEKARARQCQLEELQTLALQFHEAVEPLGEWLSATERRLSTAEPMGTQTSKITQQITKHKSLNEEIVSRKKQVDQAIKNGQALLKQTTGEEVLLIQEKLDGIKSRYAEMTAGSSKALRTLEQALQLSTRFASAHDDLNQWLDKVEAELNVMEPDATPAYQDRQKELKCVSAEKRLVLDTVNEVGNALLDLVPWRAREGLDRLVADANQRYRTADETITQRVKLVQAAIQRSQQYEEAVDAELTWAGETERKLSSLGPLSLEPDVTVAQLQVQRAFNIDIIRHKDTVDQLLNTRDDILETCSDQQRDSLLEKTESLSARYEAVSQQHQERFSALEQAQVLVARFWETQEDLEPWLGETETLIAQLPPPAIDTEALRLQQEQMRLLRESIAEHKPHIDKLLKIGPQLAALSHQEGATVRQRYSDAEKRYVAIKEVIKGRATTLDEAVSQSAQFHDKMDPLLETLEGAVQRLRSPPPVAAEADKIREQLADHKATGLDLDKLLPSFSALCARGEELINRAAHDDPAAQGGCLKRTKRETLHRAEEREGKLTDVLDLAGKFWADMAALLSTLRDSQDIVKELEDPGVDPSLIKQQIEAAEAIKAETDGLREELEFVRTLGADLIFACGETEKPEVKKTIDEMNAAWEGLNRTWRERMERLEEAMTASVQYQDALQSMFDYLDNAVIKLCDMSTVGTDLGTVKQQIDELKQYKVEVYQQQIDMEKLCHQGELLLKKVSDQTDRDMIQEPLTELRHLWDNLGDKITHRQHKLEGALLALGQFQHALSELQSWLSHTHATLDTQRPINSDPKAIEIELAKHHVLRNDVLSHRSTVETVNAAGAELLESSPGDEANHLRDQLDHLNRGWENLLLKTQDRQKLLEAALHQAEGFHGELEEFLQWLRRTESQLSAAKPTGGLPETAREQLQQHLELQTQLAQRAEQYNRLLDAGESMLLSRGGEEGGPGAGTTQTQQNLALLQNKWASLNTKMDDRRAKLDEAVSLATGFQSSLQDTINWLTQAEQTLNMAQPPSLILDTVLFQIDEHKVFVNEVNTHREQVLALEKAGSQLRFASIKQDVVLIKNLLLSVQARWDKLVQRSLDRGRHLDEARKRAKQFHEAWRKLSDWLEEAESRLDSELEISNEPDKIKVQLTKHKEFQKALGSKQPVYDTTVRSGKAMRDKATLPEDTQKLDHLLGEVRDKWDTVCGKSVERQHKLEEALLFSGQFAEALQALVDWLYRVEPQLAEDLPVHGDLDLVSNLMDSHKAFQKELGKRTTSVHALKRSARELMETGRDDTAWVKVQLQELSNRWDTVCALSVTKQTRLQQAFKQAEEFRTAVHLLLEWLSEAEQTLRFRGVLPEEAETLQTLLHTHRNFMATVEEKRTDVNRAAGQGEAILTACQADCITTIKHWITIIRARFEEVLTWAKQHEQRLETALTELLNNATLLEELLSWLQWAETTLVQRDGETLPQDIPQLKTLITEHQVFMEEMTRKQPDVDKVTKTYKRKPAEAPSSLHQQAAMQVAGGNPRLTQLCSRWQQVWLLALDRQRKLNDALDRLEEVPLKEFASFDFDVWRKRYMRWMNHKKSRVMDFFRRIDKDQDGKITRQEFIDGILASKFPTSRLEMTAVADIFDQDGDGYIDYYEFVAALHPNKDAYRPTTDADKIEDEVTRQVAQCKCAKRFQVEQIGENKYRFFLGNQFGDSQQLRLVRILRSTVMVRVGGGWMALDEFLVKNDPCRARGRTNLELREKFILPEGASQGLAAFRSRGRRSKPGSRTASPTRSSSSASHSAHSCASLPSTPATPTTSSRVISGSKLKRPTFHSSRGSLTGENGGATPTSTKPGRTGKNKVRTPSGASGAASRAGSRAGSRASSRRGSDASDASELLETHSACSDTSDTPRRPGAAKPSKIPTISKKAPSPKTPTSGKK
uniref:Microtubule actin crosslinking factor 1 n=1 Tax=Hucho hucho TaxID=62062 RepID=A0A4W5PVB9_9TELE